MVSVASNINDVKNESDNHDIGRISCATAQRVEQSIPDHLLEHYAGASTRSQDCQISTYIFKGEASFWQNILG